MTETFPEVQRLVRIETAGAAESKSNPVVVGFHGMRSSPSSTSVVTEATITQCLVLAAARLASQWSRHVVVACHRSALWGFVTEADFVESLVKTIGTLDLFDPKPRVAFRSSDIVRFESGGSVRFVCLSGTESQGSSALERAFAASVKCNKETIRPRVLLLDTRSVRNTDVLAACLAKARFAASFLFSPGILSPKLPITRKYNVSDTGLEHTVPQMRIDLPGDIDDFVWVHGESDCDSSVEIACDSDWIIA